MAVRVALDWIYSMLQDTVSMPPPNVDFELWEKLFREGPRKWKGWLKRAAELSTRQTQLQAEVETFERVNWKHCEDAEVPVFQPGQHGCLLCKVAVQMKQAWAAHAVRSHDFRLRQAVVARGTQCQACMCKFTSKLKFIKHLQAMHKCLEQLEALNRPGRLVSLTDEAGHVQAPPDVTHVTYAEGPAHATKCPDLLQALHEQQPSTSARVVDIACRLVAPSEDLFATLMAAADCVGPEDTRAAIRSALPQFRVDVLCDKGQVLKQVRDALGFTPKLVRFPPACRPKGLVVVGDPDACRGLRDTDVAEEQQVAQDTMHDLRIPS